MPIAISSFRVFRVFGAFRVFSVVLVLAPAAVVAAQQPTLYKQPPDPIPAMLDAEPLPTVAIGPRRDRVLLIHRSGYPDIEEVSAPFLRLAGDRINPRTNGSWYETTIRSLSIKPLAGGLDVAIAAPARGRITSALWAPDGRHLALFVRGDSGITVWSADARSGRTRQLTRWTLVGAAGEPCSWASSVALICRMTVPNRGAPPHAPEVPTGPVVQESEGGTAVGNPTYEDLLESPTDEALFDYYYTSQLAVVGLDGSVKAIGKPGVYVTTKASPDGNYLLVQALHRPYSYQVTRFRFPTRTELWAMDGRVIRQLADIPLQEHVPNQRDAVAPGLRSPSWRADAAATLTWVEALDGGIPTTAAAKRDRVLVLSAPFTGEPRTLLETELRFGGITWGRDTLAIVEEYWRRNRRERASTFNPSRSGQAAVLRVLWDRSYEDRYGDPGSFVTTAGPFGDPVLEMTGNGSAGFLIGSGASPEGDRPFLDRLDLATGRSERLWRSAAPYYEMPLAVIDVEPVRFVTRRESVTDVPNYYVRDLGTKSLAALTAFEDPAPQFAGVTKQLITYTRPDGVQLSATLYLPAGYDKSHGPLPFLFWAYPQEFKSARAASQVTGSPYRFTRPTGMSHLFMLTQGYGVLDNPTMPIVGEGDKEPNDTYVQQLVASAKAAVDKVVEMGVADRDRIGIGGHSYGAFMTANLLAHSNLFRAGIARSGAYNRSLTPFGFQNEERTYWRARDVYMAMSPFNYADSVSAPILLIHGIADDNTGTFPVQSERFFAALKGNGKRARLVMMPAEPHGYRARESLGHVLWEMATWLDTYVKPPSRTPAE